MEKQSIKPLKDLIARCFRCGLCRAVCPVFLEIGLEPAAARGKVQLVQALLAGDLEPSENLAHLISRCMICGACQEACPGDVEVREILLRARADLARSLHLEDAEETSSIFSVSQWRRYLGALRSSPHRPLPAVLNLLTKRPVGGLPLVPSSAVSSDAQQAESPRAGIRVGYFPGCASSLYPRVGKAVLEVLEKNHIQTIVPESLLCCGAPFLEAGDFDTARKLAQVNVEAFAGEDVEAIVVSCSAGLQALRRDYESLLGLRGFRVPVIDLAEFLADVLHTREGFSPLAMKVAYMDAGVSPKDVKWHRKLLAEIPELELVQMEDSEGRCGESLFFAALHPELFRRILGKKLAAVAETGATVIVTGSPICMWQLEAALQDRGRPVKVMHTAEVLAAAYEGGRVSPNKARTGVSQRKKS